MLHFFLPEILHLGLGELGPTHLLSIVDLKPPHRLEIAKKTPETCKNSQPWLLVLSSSRR